ncbi:MAG: PH domain-containing protein [Bacteroidetes bacterium]|nr:PH domain-containing protein [Bacteroidota bacterium]MCY4233784.1 PH domain-containing protein [Bacteroidota bacterium]
MEAPSEQFLRLHPLTFVHSVFLSIVAFAYSWLTSLGPETTQFSSTATLIFAIITIVIAGPFAIAKFIRFRYYATSDELIIYYGVFKRVRRNIPAERIQNVAIKRSLLSRILGTASVRIETAGTDQTEGNLSYVGAREAQRLKDLLRTSKNTVNDPPPDQSIFSMPLRRVLVSSLYQFSHKITLILFTIFFQLLSLEIIDVRATIDYLVERGYFQETVSNHWPLITSLSIILTVMTGWGAGFIQNLIRFYNFKIELTPTKIQRRFGLFTLQEGSLSYKRVQSFLIRSNPVMRFRRWYRLELQTLGLQSGEQGFQPAMPFARWSEILDLAPKIRPFTLPESYTSVSLRTIQRYSIRYSWVIIVSVALFCLIWSTNALWGLLILPIVFLIALLQYQRHHWAFYDENLFIHRRILSQQFWIIPVERFQAFEITSSFFQRRLGLCTLIVDTAGAGTMRYPRIIDMRRGDAERLTEDLNLAFQRLEGKHSSSFD